MEINRQKNEKESTTQNSTRMRSRAKITRKRESLCVNIGMYTYHLSRKYIIDTTSGSTEMVIANSSINFYLVDDCPSYAEARIVT